MQTLTIQEAGTRLQALVKQAQTSQQPVLLTDEVAAPMAVLTPVLDLLPDQRAAVWRRMAVLTSVMQMWQEHEDDPIISRDAAQLCQSQLRQLTLSATDAPPAFGALAMLLRLAVRQVATPTPPAQVRAITFGIDQLAAADLGWGQVAAVDQLLVASGIEAHADFGNEELLNSYVNLE